MLAIEVLGFLMETGGVTPFSATRKEAQIGVVPYLLDSQSGVPGSRQS